MDLQRADKPNQPQDFERRSFIKLSAGILAAVFTPQAVFARARNLLHDERQLSLYNLHTDERLNVCYCRNGVYDQKALQTIDRILRDHRTGEVHPIEPRLLDLLHALSVKTGSNRFHIISGYRSPATNSMLRKDGRKVASRSLHTRGMAVDIRMPDLDTELLYEFAVDLERGGAGHYPGRNFVHVDVGRVRSW